MYLQLYKYGKFNTTLGIIKQYETNHQTIVYFDYDTENYEIFIEQNQSFISKLSS